MIEIINKIKDNTQEKIIKLKKEILDHVNSNMTYRLSSLTIQLEKLYVEYILLERIIDEIKYYDGMQS